MTIPREVRWMMKGADVLRGSRVLAERMPAERRDPRADDPRVETPAQAHYRARCERLRP